MAVIRPNYTEDTSVNYIATLAFFCCVSCITLMLKFGRFKTSFNIIGGKKKSKKEHDSIGSTVSISGAYRSNRDEFYVYNNYSETQSKTTPSKTPVTRKFPIDQPVVLRQTKSTSDLIRDQNLPTTIREAQSGVSLDPRGATHEYRNSRTPADTKNNKPLDAHKKVEKQRLEEQKRLEKQRLEEEKKRDKLIVQQQAKEEKLRKEREKKDAQLKKKKKTAPQRPVEIPVAHSSGQAQAGTSNQRPQLQYSTNTLESSISKTSGPPPYSDIPEDKRGNSNRNVIFDEPEDTGSWDMISKHRNNISTNRTKITAQPTKGVTTMDLNYNVGAGNSKYNSKA